MIFGFFRRRKDTSVRITYERIVAQARQPVFYERYGIPDTSEGRFEMIVLHAFCVFHRLREEDTVARKFAQAVFDYFFEDMDQSMRELGIGDEGVRRRVRVMVESFYGRASSYMEALENKDDTALFDAFERNIYGQSCEPVAVRALVHYMHEAVAGLAVLPTKEILAGDIEFVAPKTELIRESASDG
ncbi:Ubiquinol-cytochrome C chaperone [Pseudovibrio axinellae]|uniref:Ubiquinol-cytochrome C chaperone n=1 Tax=Pseudovibrio axinellae TaxID=989403 RepID=A0A161VBI8_9HYPH|nr:ubiquinol-cytochrome C chaperone family protein [Pseudovibrio axinellae]KZL16738.1 Ubiquinol-cytochrome C chaperone [Pseudovibrio axinellae]SEQ76634.1 cytochrome b pre-mRNA-processing protein 3 [Pseudovibrio axinellae]